MPTRRCCRCGSATCLICSDNFNRADSDSLGAGWVEKTGDWDISSDTLVAATDGVVLTSCRQGQPWNTTYNYIVSVDLLDGTGPWGVICKYTSADNYDWIEFTVSGSAIFPTFWRRTGGVDALVMDITTHPAGIGFPIFETGATAITICYSEIGWSVLGPSPEHEDIWTTCDCTAATSLPADATVGFVGFTKGDFDNWAYYYHRLSNRLCGPCDCHCSNPSDETDYKCIPETLTLTLHPTVAFEECDPTPADIVVTLYQSNPDLTGPPPAYDASPYKLYWYSDVIDMVDWFEYNWFVLECVGDGVFRLHYYKYPGSPGDSGLGSSVFTWLETPTSPWRENDSVNCTPIVLHFQTLRVNYHQTVEGGAFFCEPATAHEYELWVTE